MKAEDFLGELEVVIKILGPTKVGENVDDTLLLAQEVFLQLVS